MLYPGSKLFFKYIGEYMKNSRNKKNITSNQCPRPDSIPVQDYVANVSNITFQGALPRAAKGLKVMKIPWFSWENGMFSLENPMVLMGSYGFTALLCFTGKNWLFSLENPMVLLENPRFLTELSNVSIRKSNTICFLENGGIFHCLDWFADGFRYPRDGSCCFLSPGNWYLRFSNALKSSGEIIVGHVDILGIELIEPHFQTHSAVWWSEQRCGFRIGDDSGIPVALWR